MIWGFPGAVTEKRLPIISGDDLNIFKTVEMRLWIHIINRIHVRLGYSVVTA